MMILPMVCGFVALAAFANSSGAAQLVAHWKMDEVGTPFADAGGGVVLGLDFNTTAPVPTRGADGGATRLRWENSPGVATRLIAYSPAVQRDSFGFSFWLHPVDVAPFENLIGKEMQSTAIGPAFSRLAWQVQVSGDGKIEFLVRGSNRAQGIFSAA